MATKIEIKEEDSFPDEAALVSKGDFFTKYSTTKTNSDADNYDTAIKREIKSEIPFPDFRSQDGSKCFPKQYLKQIRSETVTGSKICEIDTKAEIEEQTLVSDFGSQNKSEFLPEDPVMAVNKSNSDHEIVNKMEIKLEPWWLETETSSVCDDIKGGDFLPVNSRLCMESISGDRSGKSSLPHAEVSGTDTKVYDGNVHCECEGQESDLTEIPTIEHVHSKECGKCNDGEIYCKALYLKQKNFINKNETQCICNICEKSITHVSCLKSHEPIQGVERPFQCKICDKNFTKLYHLERHNLIHEGKKPHQCKTCEKSFTELSNLKRHILIHEGKKPHHCKTCDKSFTQLAGLKKHKLIHEGKKPYKCKLCDKNFTQLSGLKRHNLIHEGNKPHHCKTCNKSFTQMSNLRRHSLTHESKKSPIVMLNLGLELQL